jgi:peptidylprolyl isomerase
VKRLVALMVLLSIISSGCAVSKMAKKEAVMKESVVVFETNQGNIEFKLMPDAAPKTCENFVGLVENGYYDGLVFHRVIKGFMIQGGDPTGTGMGGDSLWGKPFEDEVASDVTFSKEGILAMANSGPNTNGSQFFITTASTPWLNMKHTIFGEVVSGFDVIEKIENTPTGSQDKPVEEQVILKAYVKK